MLQDGGRLRQDISTAAVDDGVQHRAFLLQSGAELFGPTLWTNQDLYFDKTNESRARTISVVEACFCAELNSTFDFVRAGARHVDSGTLRRCASQQMSEEKDFCHPPEPSRSVAP